MTIIEAAPSDVSIFNYSQVSAGKEVSAKEMILESKFEIRYVFAGALAFFGGIFYAFNILKQKLASRYPDRRAGVEEL